MFFGDVLYPSLCAVLTQILYPDVRRAQGWCIYTHQRGAWTCLLLTVRARGKASERGAGNGRAPAFFIDESIV